MAVLYSVGCIVQKPRGLRLWRRLGATTRQRRVQQDASNAMTAPHSDPRPSVPTSIDQSRTESDRGQSGVPIPSAALQPRRWHVPAAKVLTGWRRLLGWQVMEEVFWRAAGSIACPATPRGQAALWCGLELCAIDGFQTGLPGTGASREEFGSSGTSGGSGPFPQARAVLVTARAGRAMLGAAMDACSVGEQTLIARLVAGHPGLSAGRVFVVDRNFPRP